MANLTEDGNSNYAATGTPDTYTAASDGVTGTPVDAKMVNGVVKAMVEVQTLLGDALTLKGSMASLMARLQRILNSDGAIRKGTSFPATPVPVEGDLFFRTDLDTLYVYDGATWLTMFEGAGSGSIDHGSIAGLGDDDHTIYSKADGTRDYTGNVKIKKDLPLIRLKGTEASANEYGIWETGGNLEILFNTGTEGSPTWVGIASYNRSTLQWTLTGSINAPTLLTPVVANLSSMQHDHSNAAGGGQIGKTGLGNASVGLNQLDSTVVTGETGFSGNLVASSVNYFSASGPWFWPMIYSAAPSDNILVTHNTDSAGDNPRFGIKETGGGTPAFNIDFRRINT